MLFYLDKTWSCLVVTFISLSLLSCTSPTTVGQTGGVCDAGYTGLAAPDDLKKMIELSYEVESYAEVLVWEAGNNLAATMECSRVTGNPPVTYTLQIRSLEELMTYGEMASDSPLKQGTWWISSTTLAGEFYDCLIGRNLNVALVVESLVKNGLISLSDNMGNPLDGDQIRNFASEREEFVHVFNLLDVPVVQGFVDGCTSATPETTPEGHRITTLGE